MKTLKELHVKEGDLVEYLPSKTVYEIVRNSWGELDLKSNLVDDVCGYTRYWAEDSKFRSLSVGSLSELKVGVGDVVQYVGMNYENLRKSGDVWKINRIDEKGMFFGVKDSYGKDHKGVALVSERLWRVVSKVKPVPKMWKDMSPEEKGALLLAQHEGKPIEWLNPSTGWTGALDCGWNSRIAYRIKPPAVIVDLRAGDKVIGTIEILDGVPDLKSINLS